MMVPEYSWPGVKVGREPGVGRVVVIFVEGTSYRNNYDHYFTTNGMFENWANISIDPIGRLDDLLKEMNHWPTKWRIWHIPAYCRVRRRLLPLRRPLLRTWFAYRPLRAHSRQQHYRTKRNYSRQSIRRKAGL